MRIAFLNPAAQLGGAERCLLDMIASIREADCSAEPHLVVSAQGPLIERAEKLGARVTFLPMPDSLVGLGDSILRDSSRVFAAFRLGRQSTEVGWATWNYVRALGKTLGRLRPDLIHSNGIKFHLLAGLAAPSRVPLVWHIHDFLGRRPRLTRALRLASFRAHAAIAVSREVLCDMRTNFRRLPVELVYNAIDTDEFSPGPAYCGWLDQLAGLPQARPETLRIGLVATYARWKGHEVFLQAACRLLRTTPCVPVRFYLVGGPIYQTSGSQFTVAELRAAAADLDIGPNVGFIPFQAYPADVYRALDIVVHASTQPEPFGRTIVEAMACARPVVVAQCGGAAELFTHNHDAIGIPPSDSAALAAALSSLVSDSDRRRFLAANARQTAVKRFSRPRLGLQILSVYGRVVNKSRAA